MGEWLDDHIELIVGIGIVVLVGGLLWLAWRDVKRCESWGGKIIVVGSHLAFTYDGKGNISGTYIQDDYACSVQPPPEQP